MTAPLRRPCPVPGCHHLRPCPVDGHEPEPWRGSRRRERTVSGSRQQKRARRVLRRYGAICHVCGLGGADQADHVVPLAEGGPDNEENMRPIHSRPCHERKTAEESQRARNLSGS